MGDMALEEMVVTVAVGVGVDVEVVSTGGENILNEVRRALRQAGCKQSKRTSELAVRQLRLQAGYR